MGRPLRLLLKYPVARVLYDHNGYFNRDRLIVPSAPWPRQGLQSEAQGLLIRKEGIQEFLYQCDTKRPLRKTTVDGEEVLRIAYSVESHSYESNADPSKKKYRPTIWLSRPIGLASSVRGLPSPVDSEQPATKLTHIPIGVEAANKILPASVREIKVISLFL